MSNASPAGKRRSRRGSRLLEDSVRFAKQHRQAWPAVAIVVITVAAYHFTLLSLYDFLRLDTPLAYLPLLPLFCIGIARAEGARRVIATDINAYRLGLANKMGADALLDTSSGNAVDDIRQAAGGPIDVVLAMSGNAAAFRATASAPVLASITSNAASADA